MLNELTNEQNHLMASISAEYEKNTLSGNDSYDINKIQKGINFIYSLSDMKEPGIVISSSPMHMVQEAKLTKGETIDYLGCGYDSGWTAFYDFFQRIGIEYDKEWGFDIWKDFILNSGVFATVLYENVAFVCIRPCLVKINENDDLHCIDGPAIGWVDGYCEYSLNGVWVPEYLVMTPEGELDIKFFKEEKNADVKAEFIRKYGIQRMLSLGEKICDANNNENKWYVESEYEIWNMGSVFNKKSAPFLKMKNLTTGIYHFEGLPDNCNTIEDALKYRAKNRTINLQGVA